MKEDKCKAGAGFHMLQTLALRQESTRRVSPHSQSKSDLFPNILDIQRVERYPTTQQNSMSKHNRAIPMQDTQSQTHFLQKSPASKGEA